MLSTLDDIEILDNKEPIGEGAFSKVMKCRLKKDKKIYALKVVGSLD